MGKMQQDERNNQRTGHRRQPKAPQRAAAQQHAKHQANTGTIRDAEQAGLRQRICKQRLHHDTAYRQRRTDQHHRQAAGQPQLPDKEPAAFREPV